ncbi:MAG: DUF692 family protein [Candidatus Adiutrix sp.]|jgi:hypothetical protein|nr:DUF692 family protein [Candidatus Adiutrix sp.]
MDLGLVISHQFAAQSAIGERLAQAAAVWSLREPQLPGWLPPPGRAMFHWGLGPTLADFRPAFARQGLDKYLAESPPELFSFDLGPAARRHSGILPLSPPLGPSAIRRHTEAGLKLIRRHYSGPLAAENYNFYPTGLYRHVTEPGFIRDYLTEFDLGLCLDLAHAVVTAHNLGLTLNAYVEALPLERTAEVHISRPWLPVPRDKAAPQGIPGRALWPAPQPCRSKAPLGPLWAVDAHEAPEEREWAWLATLVKSRCLPGSVPVFVEYYRDLGKLEKAQARLAILVKGDAE